MTPGVADHVGVGEVDDPEARAVLAPVRDERVGRGARAHLRLLVVGRDVARRGHELALLALVGLLLAAVEEVRHVGVLLGLGDVQLAHAALGERRRERHLGPRGRERDREREVLLVLGHRHDAVARDVGEASRDDLAHPVGAEVEADDAVAAGRTRASSPTSVGSMNSSVSPRYVGLPHGVRAAVGAVRRLPLEQQVRRPSGSAPSACRGPSRSSARSTLPTRPAPASAHQPSNRLEELRAAVRRACRARR